MEPTHTSREYEQELRLLREQIHVMGRKVGDAIANSMRALATHDIDVARQTIEADHGINRMEVDIDDLCRRMLALRQPVASDLRFITTALKLVTDLERIGDIGVNIAERATELEESGPASVMTALQEMAESAGAMVRDALDAFLRRDANLAQAIIERDLKMDAKYVEVFRQLLDHMMSDPSKVYADTRLQAVAKHLERVGDHATNLAEMTVFLVHGKDIRHLGKLEARPKPRGVLFLCVRNSARSQIAEGWARRLFPSDLPVWSAGSQPGPSVHPIAVQVMREVDIDIAHAVPKRISDVPLEKIDTVVTLCEEEVCVPLPGERPRETWPLSDPATALGTDDERLEVFRRTRDDLHARIAQLASAWR